MTHRSKKEWKAAIERQDQATQELVELRVERDDLRSLVRFNEQTLKNIRTALDARQLRDAASAHLLRDALSALKLTVSLLARRSNLPAADERQVARLERLILKLTDELDAYFMDAVHDSAHPPA